MGLIQEELKLAEKKDFKTIKYKTKDIVEISRENVAIAEVMIKNDSDYIDMYNTKAKKSGAYYLSQLKELYEAEKKGIEVKENVEEIISNAVIAIDNENSTHLNSDGVGRTEIPQRIYNEYRNGRLFELLKNPGEDYELFRIIEVKTSPNDEKKRGRVNTSFASKFCHYAAFFVFEGKKEQDNYSIWDSVLRKTIPIYLDYYEIDARKYNLKDYYEYQKAIDEIINKASDKTGIKISRNGFDHLLWYYYKGRLDEFDFIKDVFTLPSTQNGWESFKRMITDMKIKRLSDTKAVILEVDGNQTNLIECLKGKYDGLVYSLRMLDEGEWIMGLDYVDIRRTLFSEYYNEKWKDRIKQTDSFEYYYMEWRNISKDGNIEVIENEIKNALKLKNKKVLNMAAILCGEFNFSVFRRYGEILNLSEGDEFGWEQGCLQKNIPLSLHVFLWCK